MRSQKSKYRWAAVATAAIALLLGGLTITAPASATPSSALAATLQGVPTTLPDGARLVSVTTGRMVPDCARLTAKARSYALAHNIHICGLNGSSASTPNAVEPFDEVPGDCGTSSIYAYQAPTDAHAEFIYGFNSTAGEVIWRDLHVNWDGQLHSGSYPDAYVMAASTYNASIAENTGRGRASADLVGETTLVWGLDCSLEGAASSVLVA